MGCCCSHHASESGDDEALFNHQKPDVRIVAQPVTPQPQVARKSLNERILSQRLSSGHRRKRSKSILKDDEPKCIFGWGENANGELGLDAQQNSYLKDPTLLKDSWRVRSIACGDSHTVFLLTDGTVWACGSNDHGQLGHENKSSQPALVKGLNAQKIIAVSAGYAHSLALDKCGVVYSWGSDSHGQLGQNLKGDKLVTRPEIIQSLIGKVVVQIAAGHSHSIILTDIGEIYTCGSNRNGQLGFSSPRNKLDQFVPCLVEYLTGFPTAFVGAGDFHSFAASISGSVFGWGKNNNGQLGVGDTEDKWKPTHLKTLKSHCVCYVAAGSNHSAFLTRQGGVFTCGDGKFGQLGHPTFSSEILPRKILEFGSNIVQIACKRGTTLCTTALGKVYSFGNPEMQKRSTESNSPKHISGMGEVVHSVYAGSGQSFALVDDNAGSLPRSYCDHDEMTQILVFTPNSINKICSTTDDNIDQNIETMVEALFSSVSSYNASFLQNQKRRSTLSILEFTGIDLDEAESILSKLELIKSPHLAEKIDHTILHNLIPKLPLIHRLQNVEMLRVYVLITLLPSFYQQKCFTIPSIPVLLASHSLSLPPHLATVVFTWMYNLKIEQLHRLVSVYKKTLLGIIESDLDKTLKDANLKVCLEFLKRLNLLNRLQGAQARLSYHAFTIPQISDKIDLTTDYVGWLLCGDNGSPRLFFCGYPFIFDSNAKSVILQVDQGLQMKLAMEKAAAADVLTTILLGTREAVRMENLCLNMTVSRDNIVNDTISHLMTVSPEQFKRPLRIKFVNEEAIDAGGVRKEFFLLLIREILDEKYGMFKHYEESRLLWFNEKSLEDTGMFFLIGVVLGLAIYNFTIINLPFPLALYKKLLGEKISLEDFKELEPTLAGNLEKLIEYEEPDLEDIFCLNFAYDLDEFGVITSVPLKDVGSDIPVTQGNKQEYVDLYVDHKMNVATSLQFTAFKDGFERVCGSTVLSLFHPEQLQEMVIGNEDYDWGELQQNCTYNGGYNGQDIPIVNFWEVFHELTLVEKRQFLLFVTGSDRIPVSGMKGLQMIIQQTGSEEHLPVAHTCFNQLDLPPYQTKECLRYKLAQAIQHYVGFSIV